METLVYRFDCQHEGTYQHERARLALLARAGLIIVDYDRAIPGVAYITPGHYAQHRAALLRLPPAALVRAALYRRDALLSVDGGIVL